jgi:hypothetical protein
MDQRYLQLKEELKKAITAHYERLTRTIPDIYGYSLYTHDGVSSMGPVANRTSALKVGPDDKMYNYYRYGAVEWSEWDDFGLFDQVNAILSEMMNDEGKLPETEEFDPIAELQQGFEFAEKRGAILRTALEALCELEAGGLFGPRSAERFVVISICDSSDEMMLESAKRLNDDDVYQAYAKEFGD